MHVTVIGSGFAGLASASFLAKKGYEVTLLEKNEGPGGRASMFKAEGFTFDMGPSWYWMPGVFDSYFEKFGKKVSDYYDLKRLDPSYRIFFSEEEQVDLPAKLDELYALFESYEPGCTKNLDKFLSEAEYKYEVGINEVVYKPSLSLFEFADFRFLKALRKLQMLTSIESHVGKLFKDERIRKILEFPVYFLGALPKDTPALYSLMNYADLVLGTWYPMGGMHKIIEGMVNLAKEQGVEIIYNQNVTKLDVKNGVVEAVVTDTHRYETDIVLAGADYHHVETKLLDKKYQQYNASYWDKRVMAPSSLIFYLGTNKKIKGLKHHNLFFDRSFKTFGKEIYTEPQWPSDPLFYVCCPSKTDSSVAPENSENIFVLIPVAPGLEDKEELREKYYDMVMTRLEKYAGTSIREHVIYKRSFAHKDFKSRYNAFKGNAYGLANTLKQTAMLKPRMKSKKVKNLFYAGQLTVPGPGVPPSLISGEVAAHEIEKIYQINKADESLTFSH